MGPLSIKLGRERTALLGLNGAGKSTTMFGLLGLLPHRGVLSVDGEQCPHLPPEKTGFVPQEPDYPGLLTGRECVAMAAELKGVDRRASGAAVDRALADAGLTGRGSHRAVRMSGGQKRRLAFAQAMVHRPEILLLDEPTAGLDPVQRTRFRTVLAELPEQMSVIVTTHILEDVVGWADRFLVLNRGELVRDVRAADLGTQPLAQLESILLTVDA